MPKRDRENYDNNDNLNKTNIVNKLSKKQRQEEIKNNLKRQKDEIFSSRKRMCFTRQCEYKEFLIRLEILIILLEKKKKDETVSEEEIMYLRDEIYYWTYDDAIEVMTFGDPEYGEEDSNWDDDNSYALNKSVIPRAINCYCCKTNIGDFPAILRWINSRHVEVFNMTYKYN